MANRVSSAELSSLAGKVLNLEPAPGPGLQAEAFNALLTAAKSLAGSVLSQDEDPGNAGTSAYEMVAATAEHQIGITESLIHLVAATVIAKMIERQGPVVTSGEVTFSPADMDATFRDYQVDATHDGMQTTVRITPKTKAETDPPTTLYAQDGIDVDDVKPQVQAHDYGRPVWAIRYFSAGHVNLAKMGDRADAERHLLDYTGPYDAPEPTIENRMCFHPGCPSDRCLEATSAVDGGNESA